MAELRDFFYNKRVLITGHTGFKGTWLSLMLEYFGAKVYGYSLAPDTNFYLKAMPVIVGECIADISDNKSLNQFLQSIKPEIIIHLAAHSTLTRANEITSYIFRTNIMGTVNLLESVRKINSVKAILVVTSDKCYRNMESNFPYDENNPLGAQDSYSTSKACQDLVAECYRRSFFKGSALNIPLATARASNVLGGGDYHYDRLLPSIISSCLRGENPIIRNPTAIRPWQYVLDVLTGYLLLVKKIYETEDGSNKFCDAYNFGPNDDGFVTVEEMVKTVLYYFPNINFERSVEKKDVIETKTLKITSEKAKKILNWHRKYSFKETIAQAIEFAKREHNGEAVRDICFDFIKRSEVK